jgi:hypothetical protein
MNQELAKEVLSVPLNDAQLELLKLLASSVPYSEDELKQLKALLYSFTAERAIRFADKAWEEKGYTQADMDRLLHTHMRTPYKSKMKTYAIGT